MLKRLLATATVTAGLVLSPVGEFSQPVQAEEVCTFIESCLTTPLGKFCLSTEVCITVNEGG